MAPTDQTLKNKLILPVALEAKAPTLSASRSKTNTESQTATCRISTRIQAFRIAVPLTIFP